MDLIRVKEISLCGRYDKWIQNLQYIHLKPAKVCAGVFTSVVCSVIVSNKLRAKDFCESIFEVLDFLQG